MKTKIKYKGFPFAVLDLKALHANGGAKFKENIDRVYVDCKRAGIYLSWSGHSSIYFASTPG